jgi:putative membrane protein
VTTSELKRVDRNFIEKAARTGMDEVLIAKVAAERTSNPDVRNLAEKIAADHANANQELIALASAKGVSLPAKDTSIADKWTKRNARSFDKDYLQQMTSDHKDVLDLFRKESTDGVDPDLVAFARKTLPILEQHYQRATDLRKALKD